MKSALRLAVAMLLVSYAVLVPVMPWVEGRLFPVVDQVEVRTVGVNDLGWAQIAGSARKLRDCRFDGLNWYLGKPGALGAQVQVYFAGGAVTRPSGLFTWDNWQVQTNQIDQGSVAIAVHHCHPFWKTYTYFWTGAKP